MELTELLESWRNPDPAKREEVMRAVYQELRRLAVSHMRGERSGHTLSPTALVHEFYLRSGGNQQLNFTGRREFFAYASSAMRAILVDYARQRNAQKRGGGASAAEMRDSLGQTSFGQNGFGDAEEVLAVHEALSRLESLDPQQASIVELRYFGGLTSQECAALLGLTAQDVDREWRLARAWLKRKLNP